MKNAELTKKARDLMQSLEAKIGETIGLGVLLPESAEAIVLAGLIMSARLYLQVIARSMESLKLKIIWTKPR